MAFVACPEHIDPQKFGVLVARNRGEQAEAFTTEEQAVAWLKGGDHQESRAAAEG